MKKGILFVGSFKSESESGHVGGQMFACNSLLNSEIKNSYNWYLVDSTAPSVISASFIKRSFNALKRILKCLKLLISEGKNIHTALIFSVHGFSFIEKGIIALIAKMFGKHVIIAPRSGLFPGNFSNIIFKSFIQLVFRNADWVICQGSSWRKFFANELPSVNLDKFIIINNWIDAGLYKSRMKTEPSKKIVITYIGWFEEFKGIHDLVNVIGLVNAVPEMCSRVEFKLAGMGSQFDCVKAQLDSQNYSNVELLGWVKGDFKEILLKQTDIYIQLSHVEGFPNSILEAMASAKAVLASDAGAISDLIQNGVNGIIVKSKTPYQAFQELSDLIGDPELRQRISQCAESTVRERFVLDVAVKKFKLILN